jgi:hypothetical protein
MQGLDMRRLVAPRNWLARRLSLSRPAFLDLLLVRQVVAHRASSGSAQHGMAAGDVTGDPTDDSALDAAFGLDGAADGQS